MLVDVPTLSPEVGVEFSIDHRRSDLHASLDELACRSNLWVDNRWHVLLTGTPGSIAGGNEDTERARELTRELMGTIIKRPQLLMMIGDGHES